LETLADQYNSDVRKLVLKLDAADRSVLDLSTTRGSSSFDAARMREALEKIAEKRPLTKNLSHARDMVILAEDAIREE
jgi:hypothetical protein